MNNEDFKCSITANVPAAAAAGAISRVWDWWAKTFEGTSKKLGDIFTVRFGETWVTFKITGFTPDKIEWTVTDCYLPWLNNKTEWTGTKPMFEISTNNNLTTINFTHVGL